MTAKRKYLSFCAQFKLAPLPLDQHKACMFVAYMAHTGMCQSSMSTYFSALRHLQVEAGLSPASREEWPKLQYTLRGIKRAQGSGPITQEIMIQIKASLFSSSFNRTHEEKVTLWAVCNIAFFGFMRTGEFMVRSRSEEPSIYGSDIQVNSHSSPTVIRILLRQAKTDTFGKGVLIHLGCIGVELCPVVALLNYMVIHPSVAGPLFITQEGLPLTKDMFVREVRTVLEAANLNPMNYAGHSFRGSEQQPRQLW